MSPEPVGLITVTVNNPSECPKELRRQLEQERSLRLILEDQVRQLERQLYQIQQTQIFEVEETEAVAMQLVTADSLPPVGHTQTVVCSPPNSRSCSPVTVLPAEQRFVTISLVM